MLHIPRGKWDDSILIVTVLANLFIKISRLSADFGSAQEVR